MNGLAPATITLIYTFGVVSAVAVLAQLALVVRGWPAPKHRARTLYRRLAGFLERTSRDIVAGFLNSVEWLVYGS